ncbi:HEAT repeat domain-containing protein [Spirilliplanes yamanashiensis]|uniref:HEAT repeat domain-containing protein n=1 Tax=Spirilliplanes yamanashiensis TaxID=42233 RepID=A0A8J4DJY3_9ACTN|nr:HEAT repeat domain-containing protein [Spirilliplanes yamanashiensis]MDP9817867.1 hypothetical protein [Spirilliplanes yamanashiensis]GIJ04677.1 hypothetical protein Sya03_40290 [Spirilliplanes yamanashiensis]
MALFVHCAPEPLARRIRRAGLTTARTHCFPVLPVYPVTHQWARELRRRGHRTTVAVTFTVPDTEPVEVGHYHGPKQTLPASAAAGLVRGLDDPLGYEVVLHRPVPPGDLRRVRRVPGTVGWRYRPGEHGRRPCACPACLPRGGYGAERLRARLGESRRGARRPYPVLLAELRAGDPDRVTDALAELGNWSYGRLRGRGRLADVAPLAAHPDPEVRRVLADVAPAWRDPLTVALLTALAADPDPDVREAAEESLADLG